MASLDFIVCPFCKKNFKVNFINSGYGILTCGCSEYPVVENIFYLKKDRFSREAVKLLKRGSEKKALFALLSLRIILRIPFYLHFHKLGFKLFIRLLSYLSYNKKWVNYLMLRERLPSYFFSLSAIDILVRDKHSRIADLGCGTGQILREIAKRVGPVNVLGVDKSFFNLFLCRTFFADPKTLLVCWDLEKNLPFYDHTFQGIMMSDTFHNVTNKKLLMREIKRITKGSGSCSIIQTLNTPKIGDIRGLSPESMQRLVKSSGFSKVSLYSNETLWYLANSNIEADLERSDLKQILDNCRTYNTFVSNKFLKKLKFKSTKNNLLKSVSYYYEPELLNDFRFRKIISFYDSFIFVSPHLDDAVLSSGYLIEKIVSFGKKVMVLTVFSRSFSAPYSPQAKRFLKGCGYKDPEKLFKDRQKEDEKAAKFLGFDYKHLGYIDAAFRKDESNRNIYPDQKTQFSGKISGKDRVLMKSLSNLLTKYVNKKTLILGPLGIGGHADHILVRKVIEGLGFPTLFWEDFPYNNRKYFSKRLFRNNRVPVKLFNVASKISQKEKAVRAYKSQTSSLFPNDKIPKTPESYWGLS